MVIAVLTLFFLGYIFIVLEEFIHINKTAIALITGILCWVSLVVFPITPELNSQFREGWLPEVFKELHRQFSDISSVLFFLLSAMTIVELIDAHKGFSIITENIKTKRSIPFLWIVVIISFFLSAVLDNLTTSIVMITIVGKTIPNQKLRWWFGGAIIIAANAGGVWSPIGDVTTTMLWIGGQISPFEIIKSLFLPAILSAFLPTLYIAWQLKRAELLSISEVSEEKTIYIRGRKAIFLVGLGGLLFVPIFKMLTHLPPVLGIMLSLGVIWIVTELIHKRTLFEHRKKLTAAYALSRIDSSSILFFFGILLAIGALEISGVLHSWAQFLNYTIGNIEIIAIVIGLASAVIDNVPLVAASIGMYSVSDFPIDHTFWRLLAYTSGTGGSILLIGSAPGVAIMGIEKVTFLWYLKHITLPAIIGFIAGAVCFILMN